MLHFNKPSQYALQALGYLLSKGPATKAAIATEEHIPPHYLAKILKKLMDHGFLYYDHRAGRCYVAHKTADSIYLYDILSLFENLDKGLHTCAMGYAECGGEHPCRLHKDFEALRKEIIAFLKNNTLSQWKPPPEQLPFQ